MIIFSFPSRFGYRLQLSCLQNITCLLSLFFIQLMPVHNASVIENGLFTSVLLSCPWLALCFAPPRPISHQHSLHTFLSSHVSPSSPAAALHLSYQCFSISLAQIQRTVCLSLAHHFRSLSLLAPYLLTVSPPCISSLYLSLFSVGCCLTARLTSAIMWGCCVSAYCWKLFLSACPFLPFSLT